MAEYINRAAAIAIADYAEDEHKYKRQGWPETYSEYNEGWNDACDYIRARLESSDVVPGQWRYNPCDDTYCCPNCNSVVHSRYDVFNLEANDEADLNFCPNCGAKMDLEE